MTKLFIFVAALIFIVTTAEENVKEWKFENGQVKIHKNLHKNPIKSWLKEEDNFVLHDDDDLIKFHKKTDKKLRHSKETPTYINKNVPKHHREHKNKMRFDETKDLHLQDLTHEANLQNHHPHHVRFQHITNERNQQREESDHNHEIRKNPRKQASGVTKSSKSKERSQHKIKSFPSKLVYDDEDIVFHENGKRVKMQLNQKAKDILEVEEFWTEAPKKKPKKFKKAFDKKKHFQKPSLQKRVKWEMEKH